MIGRMCFAIVLLGLSCLVLVNRTNAAEFEGITLGLVSPSWNTQLPSAVAQKAGFFTEQNVDVRSVTIGSGGAIMMALLASGQAQMVVAGAVAALRGISQGAPAVIVAGLVDKVDYTLVAAKGIRQISELRGKVIGSTGAGSFSEFAVIESLKRKGLTRDKDYTLLPVGGTAVRIAALRSGRVHAAPLSSGERITLEMDGYPVLMEIGEVIPEYPFLVVIATNEFVKSSPEKVVAFLRGLDRAIDLIKKDKDKAVALGKAFGLSGDPKIQRKFIEYVAKGFQLRLSMKNVASLLDVLGIKEPPERFFNDSLLNRALATK
jgi:NitT/TauT family transport system substrate-binding protein